MSVLDPVERHDRTLRFLQQAFPWRRPPARESLLESSAMLSVTVHIPNAKGHAQLQLAALAITNVVGRLPLGALRLEVDDVALNRTTVPYRGSTLGESLADLSTRLDIEADIKDSSQAVDFMVEINSPWETASWAVALDGPSAFIGRTATPSATTYSAVGCYTAACMLGGEVVRTWARCAAAAGVAEPTERFSSRTRSASDHWVDLQPHETAARSATTHWPTIDWVSCGAVNQAVLAVLAASPQFSASGMIHDPGRLDAPDLNRSLLSFPGDVGRPKAQVGAEAVGAPMAWRLGRYPESRGDTAVAWIVTGTDDPSVRPACQQFWPDRLVVTATEDVFGYAAWHSPDAPHAFCAACQPTPPYAGDEPIPTSAPTSVATGTAAAALLLQLAVGGSPPHRTDLLTLRLDSELAVERSDPSPAPGCSVCGSRSRTSNTG